MNSGGMKHGMRIPAAGHLSGRIASATVLPRQPDRRMLDAGMGRLDQGRCTVLLAWVAPAETLVGLGHTSV